MKFNIDFQIKNSNYGCKVCHEKFDKVIFDPIKIMMKYKYEEPELINNTFEFSKIRPYIVKCPKECENCINIPDNVKVIPRHE